MTYHFHIGVLTAINIFLMWMIVAFFWRTLAELWADRPIGQAMAKLA